jgi:hypothetical protein
MSDVDPMRITLASIRLAERKGYSETPDGAEKAGRRLRTVAHRSVQAGRPTSIHAARDGTRHHLQDGLDMPPPAVCSVLATSLGSGQMRGVSLRCQGKNFDAPIARVAPYAPQREPWLALRPRPAYLGDDG